jgi:type I restriction enzyme S subunit
MYPLRCEHSLIRPAFLLRVLMSDGFTDYAGDESRRARMPKLNRDQLFKFEFALPPLREQGRITHAIDSSFSSIAKARAAAQARLEAIRALPAAYLREVFPDRGEELPEGWAVKSLGDLCTIDGQYGTSVRSNVDRIGLPVLGMYNIYEGNIRWEKIQFVNIPTEDQEKYLLQKGDLLFNRTNSAELVGKSAVFDRSEEAVFASYLIRFRMIASVADSNFVSMIINSPYGRRFIEKHMARAIGQVNISASIMKLMPIPIPRIAIQRQIITELKRRQDSITQVTHASEAELAAIEALPAAILRKAFNGEL